VVIRDFPIGSLPFGAVGPLLGIYLTPDLEGYTDYTRPYLATLHEELIAAAQAGAAGVVFAFEVPGKQVRGYYDPHVGTLYRCRRCSWGAPRPRGSRLSRPRAAPPA
jgi:hypothetical protein